MNELICMNRMTASGVDSESFKIDFMVSYNRTRVGNGASMDGVFTPIERLPPHMARFQLEAGETHVLDQCGTEKKNRLEVHEPQTAAIGSPFDATKHILSFSSPFEPIYEEEQLSAITKAYPRLYLSYIYVEPVNNRFGRATMHNGTVSYAFPANLEQLVNENDTFKALIKWALKLNRSK